MQGNLLDPTQRAFARRNDVETSHAAAKSIPSERIGVTKERILAVLRIYQPLTQAEVVETFRSAYPAFQTTDQNIRSRCADLEKEGLIWFSGEWGQSPTGRKARKWSA